MSTEITCRPGTSQQAGSPFAPAQCTLGQS